MSDWLDRRIAELWHLGSARSVAAHLGVSRSCVHRRARKLGLEKQRKPWTHEQHDRLRQLYADTPTEELVRMLGHPARSIYNVAKELGLRKSPELISQTISQRQRSLTGGPQVESRFQKGMEPWNKGKHGVSCGGISTHFQPGHRPHSWVPIGTERISKDGYLERKVTDEGPPQRHFRGVHLILWEAANGPLPPHHAVVFKDGNKRNLELDNLELVSRTELMRRNSIHNYPPEVKAVITAKARLTRVIHQLERSHEEQTD